MPHYMDEHTEKRIKEMRQRMLKFPQRRKEIERQYNIKLTPQEWSTYGRRLPKK